MKANSVSSPCSCGQADKLTYRYPGAGGESYADVVLRMNDIICTLSVLSGDSAVNGVSSRLVM